MRDEHCRPPMHPNTACNGPRRAGDKGMDSESTRRRVIDKNKNQSPRRRFGVEQLVCSTRTLESEVYFVSVSSLTSAAHFVWSSGSRLFGRVLKQSRFTQQDQFRCLSVDHPTIKMEQCVYLDGELFSMISVRTISNSGGNPKLMGYFRGGAQGTRTPPSAAVIT